MRALNNEFFLYFYVCNVQCHVRFFLTSICVNIYFKIVSQVLVTIVLLPSGILKIIKENLKIIKEY